MAHRRIHNKGDWRIEEYVAGGTITPGMLIKMNSSGQVIAHDEEGGRCEVMCAMEDQLQGKTVSDNYSSADIVTCGLPVKGSVMNMLLAVGETVVIGDELVSDGAGSLQKRGVGSSGVTEHMTVGFAQEAKDNSAGSAPALMAVRCI